MHKILYNNNCRLLGLGNADTALSFLVPSHTSQACLELLFFPGEVQLNIIEPNFGGAHKKVVVEELRLNHNISIQYVSRHHLRFWRCLY